MTIFLYELGVFPVILAFGETCSAPNPLQWGIIIGLVATAGLVAIAAAGVTTASIATTIVTMIMAGASIETIAAAIAGDAATGGNLVAVIGTIVVAIKGVLSC